MSRLFRVKKFVFVVLCVFARTYLRVDDNDWAVSRKDVKNRKAKSKNEKSLR